MDEHSALVLLFLCDSDIQECRVRDHAWCLYQANWGEGIARRKGGSVCGSIPTATGKSDFDDMYMKGVDTHVRGREI